MTPRGRRRLLIAVPILGLPVLLLAALIWYIASGQAIRDAQAQWRKHLPGELLLDSLQIDSVDTVSAMGLGWEDNGQDHIAIKQVTVTGDPFAGEISGMVLDEPVLRVNKLGLKSWEALFAAIGPMMDEEETTERGPTPLILMRKGRLELGPWSLDNIALDMERHSDGGTQINLSAKQNDAAWNMRALLGKDHSLQVTQFEAVLSAQILTQALLDFMPGQADNDLALEMPETITLSSDGLQFAADGSWNGSIRLGLESPWWGLSAVTLHAEATNKEVVARAELEHSLGLSTLSLNQSALGQELVISGDPFPLAEMLGDRWTLAQPAPKVVNLSGSSFRRDPGGNLSGAIRSIFPEKWMGLQRITIDDIAFDNPFALLLSGEQRGYGLRLGLDSGHEHPLRLRLDANETRGEQQQDATYDLRVRGTDSPVSTATILAIAQAFGGFDDPPFYGPLSHPANDLLTKH